jgi:hypothetical protein
MRACEEEFEQVCVVDVASAPFALFKGVHSRHVGPFMYEWPSPFHGDQSYPSHEATPWSEFGQSPLKWTATDPVPADTLRKQLMGSLRTWAATRRLLGQTIPIMRVRCNEATIREYVRAFAEHEGARWQAEAGMAQLPRRPFRMGKGWGRAWRNFKHWTSWPAQIQPDYIILAAGMGKETDGLPERIRGLTPSFWANDGLKHPTVADHTVAVLGGGDGAMQDALRCLTVFDHPLSFIRHLEQVPVVQHLLAQELPGLLSADRQMRQLGSWANSSRGHAMVDQACREAAYRLAASPGVRRQVLLALRQGAGEVLLLVKGAHFDKAYLLNRFLIHLLIRVLQPGRERAENEGGMGLTVQFESEAFGLTPGPGAYNFLSIGPAGQAADQRKLVDQVVVRFGIQKDSIPGLQMIQITDPGLPGTNSRQRTTLSRVELPFVAM